MKFTNENIYWHETGKICKFLNRLLHGVLGHSPTIILTIFVCKVNIFPLWDELSQKNYSILYYRVKISEIHCCDGVNLAGMEH
jgi:hypothetical protein